MKLVIVESPTKAKTLSGLLDKDYDIKASMGHIRDLPKSGMGIDIEHDFKPEYEVSDKGKKTLKELLASSAKADTIILATDPDREGEAIAWHLHELLKPSKKGEKKEFERVVFHELTKDAVKEAFEKPSFIDMNLVDAQQARRILDRLVGYKLSPLLWKKVRYGLSAGRVQSVAVRLVVEKERERDEFKSEEYWEIEGNLENTKKDLFKAELSKKDSKTLKITSADQAEKIKADLESDSFSVFEIKKTQRVRSPNPPYKTSTLQQASSNIFGMPAKKTMSIAQKLFEKGLITYHRTDSFNLSGSFVDLARKFITENFGNKYVPQKPNFYKTQSKTAQEAHEAIRPTDIFYHPNNLKNPDEKKIYNLIYKRMLECQMEDALYDQTSVTIKSEKNYEFKSNGSTILFDGWLKAGTFLGLSDEQDNLNVLPDLYEKEMLLMQNLDLSQKFTQPPARYSDASLIKKLEELGIGRPSTYAPTISTILVRKYVRKESKYFVPEDVAYVVNDLLVEHFPNVVDYEFTAQMEEDLDEIAGNQKQWVPVVREFYTPFEKILAQKDKELSKKDVTNLGESDEKCPDCGAVLVFKLGKFGKFLSCSNYPKCTFAKPLEEEKVFDENGEEIKDFGKCPNCENGVFVLKKGKFGKFLACDNYPKCKTTKPFLEKIGMKCPKCNDGEIIVKKAKGRVFYGCSRYPDCDYSSWKNPLNSQ